MTLPADIERLHAALARHSAPEPNSGCVLWDGPTQSHGYGVVSFASKSITAHRGALICAGIVIPPGFCVCHRCDVRACVNPAHLFIASQAENLADMRAKGRGSQPPHVPGERCGRAKLTDDAVRKIRRLCEAGFSPRALGERFGVSAANIRAIRAGQTWRRVP